MAKTDGLTLEELTAMYHEAESELDEANDRIADLEKEISDSEHAECEDIERLENALEAIKDPLRRLLRMIDDGRLVLVDSLYALELREARDVLRGVS